MGLFLQPLLVEKFVIALLEHNNHKIYDSFTCLNYNSLFISRSFVLSLASVIVSQVSKRSMAAQTRPLRYIPFPVLTSLFGMMAGPNSKNIMIVIPVFVGHEFNYVMHVFCDGVTFNMVNCLKLPLISKSNIVWWFLGPSSNSCRAEIITAISKSLYPFSSSVFSNC